MWRNSFKRPRQFCFGFSILIGPEGAKKFEEGSYLTLRIHFLRVCLKSGSTCAREQDPQTTRPHWRQWCLRSPPHEQVNTLSQLAIEQTWASASGCQNRRAICRAGPLICGGADPWNSVKSSRSKTESMVGSPWKRATVPVTIVPWNTIQLVQQSDMQTFHGNRSPFTELCPLMKCRGRLFLGYAVDPCT